MKWIHDDVEMKRDIEEDIRQPLFEREFMELMVRMILLQLSRTPPSSTSYSSGSMNQTEGQHKDQKSNGYEGNSTFFSSLFIILILILILIIYLILPLDFNLIFILYFDLILILNFIKTNDSIIILFEIFKRDFFLILGIERTKYFKRYIRTRGIMMRY